MTLKTLDGIEFPPPTFGGVYHWFKPWTAPLDDGFNRPGIPMVRHATGTPTAKPRVKDAREAKEAKTKPEKLGRGILAACLPC